MKNLIKHSFLALVVAVSAAACSGSGSGGHSDTLKADTSVMTDTTHGAVQPAPGSNGSAISADTGLDKSGSGGMDTTKKP